MGKFLHLGMDGPSTNWNVLDLINDHQVANEFQKALDIGSCLLHILHSALQTGMIKPGWDIRHFIRYLMPHLLATMYIYVKGHPKYCTTRWIENQPVAARALDVWPSVVSTVKHWISLSKSKQPKNNKNSDTLVKHHQDLLIPAKCHFFSFIAGILKPYLLIFQSDSPLPSFMFDEISLILYCLVRVVYKKKKVDDAINLRKVMNKEFLTD